MAKEKNLTTVTSVAAADFARLVTSAGASVKATAANLAKYIIETYNGSTVAGSAQSVKAALDSLNSNTAGNSFFNTSTDINVPKDITIPSNYRGVLITLDSTSSRNGMYIMYATGSGTVAMVPVLTASGLTFATATNKLTVTSAGTTRLTFLNIANKVTE